MKNKTILVGVIAIAMVLSIAFSGVALAAQTSFSVAVADGTVRTQASITTMTHGGLPYDEVQYNRDVFAIRASQFVMNSGIDSDNGGVVAETEMNYIPQSNLQFIFVDEGLKKSRIAEGENESLCYDASVQTRITGHGLGFASASIVDGSNIAYAMNSVGYDGSLRMQTGERILSGDVNGTYKETTTEDSFKVTKGLWNATMEFTSEIPDYPALPADEESLCAFWRKKP